MARRVLRLLALLALLPWLYYRAVRGLWLEEGVPGYLRFVFWGPIEPWTMLDKWWWHTMLQPYDWPVLPALLVLAFSFALRRA